MSRVKHCVNAKWICVSIFIDIHVHPKHIKYKRNCLKHNLDLAVMCLSGTFLAVEANFTYTCNKGKLFEVELGNMKYKQICNSSEGPELFLHPEGTWASRRTCEVNFDAPGWISFWFKHNIMIARHVTRCSWLYAPSQLRRNHMLSPARGVIYYYHMADCCYGIQARFHRQVCF